MCPLLLDAVFRCNHCGWDLIPRIMLCKQVIVKQGLACDVQKRQTPDFVGDKQEKVDGDIGKVGMECKQTEKKAHYIEGKAALRFESGKF